MAATLMSELVIYPKIEFELTGDKDDEHGGIKVINVLLGQHNIAPGLDEQQIEEIRQQIREEFSYTGMFD